MEYVIKINNKIYKQAGAYSVDYTQLWASGSGRNYGDFSWSGTVAGNFDNVQVAILPESKVQLSQLVTDLRLGMFSIEYYDFELMGMKTATVYRSNFKVTSIYINDTETYVEAVALEFVPESRE